VAGAITGVSELAVEFGEQIEALEVSAVGKPTCPLKARIIRPNRPVGGKGVQCRGRTAMHKHAGWATLPSCNAHEREAADILMGVK
jgi:hypothetical protein